MREVGCLDLSPWLSEKAVAQLVWLAGGLFIWAATAGRFIKGGGRFAPERQDQLLSRGTSDARIEPERQLDGIYVAVLNDAVRKDYSDEERDKVCRSIRGILGTVSLLSVSLSMVSLAALLGVEAGYVQATLLDLYSIVDVPETSDRTVHLQHASVRDFLLDDRRYSDRQFWVDGGRAHAHIAEKCLRLMGAKLKRDICDLREPDALFADILPALVDSRIPPELRYACKYWVQHVQRSNDPKALKKMVLEFIKKHFLEWFEAMDLLSGLSDCVDMIVILEEVYVSLGIICRSDFDDKV
jgi:hypothetical protein